MSAVVIVGFIFGFGGNIQKCAAGGILVWLVWCQCSTSNEELMKVLSWVMDVIGFLYKHINEECDLCCVAIIVLFSLVSWMAEGFLITQFL